VNHDLEDRPVGIVAELPMVALEHGSAWAFVESPRQYLARIDGMPRVNGYSGFEPHGFLAEVETLNTFPSDASMQLLARLDVRYVVVRHGLVGELSAPGEVDAARPHLKDAGTDFAQLASTYPDAVRSVTRDGDSWLVELRPAPS
jgi:hypothetical protein